jgi:hypothetical protein
MGTSRSIAAGLAAVLALSPLAASAAYHHEGEDDAPNFLDAYPSKAGTKLDNCNLCHRGGTARNGSTYGSCQWCHYSYGYEEPHGEIADTLNPYGLAYLGAGGGGAGTAALTSIESVDSDGDTFSNIDEINANSYPGDANDDPTKVTAPFVVYGKAQLEAMPQHAQFLLMNTTKSGDYYAEYSGVVMQDLLKRARIASGATKVTVYSPDGYSQGHPLEDSESNVGASYEPFVNGTYPPATYYYDAEADDAIDADYGWCSYSSPGNAGRNHGDPIDVKNGLRLILALQVDGVDLVPGVLDGYKLKKGTEGPFRVIAPQKLVGPPDQASTAHDDGHPTGIWPYDGNPLTTDHNAGFCSKAATILKVEPLPAGTTDIDVLEAGWGYIDQEKIVIYGALEQIALAYPPEGATDVPWKNLKLEWNKATDPDPEATVTYSVEYRKAGATAWTPIAAAASVARNGPGGTGGGSALVIFAALGAFAVIAAACARHRRSLALATVAVVLAGVMVVACGDGDDAPATTEPPTTASTTVTLESATAYEWRVTADGPSSHNVSPVGSFTTGP